MSELFELLQLQRRIFGVCPDCSELFRLSDGRVVSNGKVQPDWFDSLNRREHRLDEQEEQIETEELSIKEAARALGRKEARRKLNKLDRVFHPLKLSADDAKPVLHPIDFIVFKGLNTQVRAPKVILLDHESTDKARCLLQDSIRRVIERRRYEWSTLRI